MTSRESLPKAITSAEYFTLSFGAIVGVAWIMIFGVVIGAIGPGGTIIALLLGGLFTVLIGCCYAEMGARRPAAGGELVYAFELLGTKAAFAVGWALVLVYVSICVFEAISLGVVLEAGYVVAVVDTRGSTSSFGARLTEIGPDEVADMDQIIHHLSHQSWSDGSVFATGVSYMATTADVATSRNQPALKGAIVRHPDFDPYLSFQRPGGVYGLVMDRWATGTREMDYGRSPQPNDDVDCLARAADCAALYPTLQPVDGDEGYVLLREALRARARWRPEALNPMDFRDDRTSDGLPLIMATTAGSQMAAVRARAKPVQMWASWHDADTAAGVIARYQSTPNIPTVVWITANVHTEDSFADPFFPGEEEPRPSTNAQWQIMLDFLGNLRAHSMPSRIINYYVLGSRRFLTTTTWPPRGVQATFYALGPDRTLIPQRPLREVTDRYQVDFTATTGTRTRWSLAPAYGDRREEDRKLLVYESSPLVRDMEIAGTPVISLHVASASTDPALHVYLEEVAPDGRVTYLTEGILRALHRRSAVRSTVPYREGPVRHSFRRADAAPMVPGNLAAIRFELFPIAALVRSGHRLRIALAGADAGNFRRYSNGGNETFEIRSTPARPSGIEIPMRMWRP